MNNRNKSAVPTQDSQDAGKVIVLKKKHGNGACGKCRNCTCHKKKN